jgi:hypothetical protein
MYIVRSLIKWDMEICNFKCKNVLLNNFEIGTMSKYDKIEPGRSNIYNLELPNMGFIVNSIGFYIDKYSQPL